jgi:hypothetical protein
MSNKYNLKITHETIRIGVCDTLEDVLSPADDVKHCFADIIKWHYLLYFDRYVQIVQENSAVQGHFDVMEFEYQRNIMQGTFDFGSLESRLRKIKEQLVPCFLLVPLFRCFVPADSLGLPPLTCSCSFYSPLAAASLLPVACILPATQIQEIAEWTSQGAELSAKDALSSHGETYACQQVNSAFQVICTVLARILLRDSVLREARPVLSRMTKLAVQ